MRPARFAFGFLLLSIAVAAGQQYVISTVAGGAPPATPAPGVSVGIAQPSRVAADTAGNVYFTSANCVFKLDPRGILTRIAGNSRPGYSGDGGPATSAQLNFPWALALDSTGNLFIADRSNNRIRKVSPGGIITTVAGIGAQGFSGDSGPAVSAQLNAPTGVAVDGAGSLFIADGLNHRIRKVSGSGIITTVAGTGMAAFSGDDGQATSAGLNRPNDVAVDGAGNLLIADTVNNRIRKVSGSGIITTVAGNGSSDFSGDGGRATAAALFVPQSVAVDGAGNLFIADLGNMRIRKVSTSGIISTVAGSSTTLGFSGDGGQATSARLNRPTGVAVDGTGNLFIADQDNNRIRKVSASGIIATVAGTGTFGFSGDGGPATGAQLSSPFGVAVDGAGNLFIADLYNNRVRKVSPGGIITTVAGNGSYGYSGLSVRETPEGYFHYESLQGASVPGDGGPATSAQLSFPHGVTVDGADNLFIADSAHQRIRKVSPSGIITTVAGDSAGLSSPNGVAVDGAGNLFIADTLNYRIKKVSTSGIITTVAGNDPGFSGDGGPASSAQLGAPFSVAVDSVGNLFIPDYGGHRIRKVSTSGIITTVAGNGTAGFSGDGGPATSAQLNAPTDVAVDGAGNLFIADDVNRRVRKVSPSGIITTVAGNGTQGFSGDGGPATDAALYFPSGVAVDRSGNVYVADGSANVVRVLRPTNQSVLIAAVVDAASQTANPVSPGKIVVIYGAGLGPPQLIQNQPGGGQFGTELGGTVVSFNGIAGPILYVSATQVAAIVPYAVTGTTVQVTVAYQGEVSAGFPVPAAPSAPGLFTLNQTGAGQAAAINAGDGTVNTAANPVKIGDYVSLYATGEGQTSPAGVDGKLVGLPPTHPLLPVSVTVGGIPATVQYAGGAPGLVAGLMQVNVQIPNGVQPGDRVPVVLQVGDATTTPGAVWIAVSGN